MNALPRPHYALRLAATVVLFASFASAADASATRPDDHDRVRAILRREWVGEERSREDVVDDLAHLGSDDVPFLFDLFIGQGLDKILREEDTLRDERWAVDLGQLGGVVLDALARQDPDVVLGTLRKRLRDDSPHTLRLSMVQVVRELAAPEGLELLVDLAATFTSFELRHKSTYGPLQDALREVLRADPGRMRALEGDIRDRELPEDFVRLVVEAVGELPFEDSIELLAAATGTSAGLDRMIATRASELALDAPWACGEGGVRLLRELLLEDDTRVVRTALVGLGRLHDVDAFSSIVLLVDDDRALVADAAVHALTEMTGGRTFEFSMDWLRWFDAERDRWNAEVEDLRADLASDEPREVLAALRALGARPLFRDLAAAELVHELDRDEPALVVTIVRAIEALGARSAVPALVPLLDPHAEEATRQAAWQALQRLTGEELLPEPESWSRYVAGERPQVGS